MSKSKPLSKVHHPLGASLEIWNLTPQNLSRTQAHQKPGVMSTLQASKNLSFAGTPHGSTDH
ncbi:hypothetical protein MIZ03_1090 [Rhodoferax lithotrophicus]|uniref:Uncharacterized protein n=1 Tax=Rhodoferax lithotrophicus TaxID=2798804 RepID=A0ABN6D2I1_9BURK|nr:hypothetical protein MIZ03_1090 [Rhodoferax sp. MIZ03]